MIIVWWLILNFDNGGSIAVPQSSHEECTENANFLLAQRRSIHDAACVTGIR